MSSQGWVMERFERETGEEVRLRMARVRRNLCKEKKVADEGGG